MKVTEKREDRVAEPAGDECTDKLRARRELQVQAADASGGAKEAVLGLSHAGIHHESRQVLAKQGWEGSTVARESPGASKSSECCVLHGTLKRAAA